MFSFLLEISVVFMNFKLHVYLNCPLSHFKLFMMGLHLTRRQSEIFEKLPGVSISYRKKLIINYWSFEDLQIIEFILQTNAH